MQTPIITNCIKTGLEPHASHLGRVMPAMKVDTNMGVQIANGITLVSTAPSSFAVKKAIQYIAVIRQANPHKYHPSVERLFRTIVERQRTGPKK